MLTVEEIGVMTAEDDKGNQYKLYPRTKIEAVDGLQEELSNLQTGLSDINEDIDTKINVALDGIQEDVNEIEIGGRNLIIDSSMELGVREGWIDYTNYVSDEGIDGGKCFKIEGSLQSTRVVLCQSQEYKQRLLAEGYFKPGEKYTISYWAKADNLVYGTTDPQIGPQISFYKEYQIVDKEDLLNQIPAGTSDWTLYKGVITVPTVEWDDFSNFNFILSDFTGTVYIDKIKMEKGNKATDWTAAPEDADLKPTYWGQIGINDPNGHSGTLYVTYNEKLNLIHLSGALHVNGGLAPGKVIAYLPTNIFKPPTTDTVLPAVCCGKNLETKDMGYYDLVLTPSFELKRGENSSDFGAYTYVIFQCIIPVFW